MIVFKIVIKLTYIFKGDFKTTTVIIIISVNKGVIVFIMYDIILVGEDKIYNIILVV